MLPLPFSRSSVLKVIAKVFDLMGFLAPFTITMKILLQELCVNRINNGMTGYREDFQQSGLLSWKKSDVWKMHVFHGVIYCDSCRN